MSTPPHENACAPTALSHLFREPYRASCRRLIATGEGYEAPSWEAIQRVLSPFVKRVVYLWRRPRRFSVWRRWRRGDWVLVVTGRGAQSRHLVLLRDGRALDNGWATEYAQHRVASLRVHAAWQVVI